MIIRTLTDDAVLMIRQPDHAALAADLMTAWQAGGFPTNRRRDRILAATRAHDNGWIEEDDEPPVGDDGSPLDFITVPVAVKQRVWPRAIERLADGDPYVAGLVAQHAMTVYAGHRTNPAWTPFFEAMAETRERLLSDCGAGTAGAVDRDYAFVRMGDLLSLAFCTGAREPVDYDGHHITLVDGTLTVSPDPFAGAGIALRIAGRRLPRRTYASAEELRAEIAAAPVGFLEGSALGG